MIFATVGLERYPFNRLGEWIDAAIDQGIIKDNVIFQYGTSTYIPKSSLVESIQNVDFSVMKKHITQADKIIAHAGVGTFLTITALGKIPIVVPRFKDKGEHLDEHQSDLSKRLEREFSIPVAYSYEQFIGFISKDTKEIDIQSFKKGLIDFLDSQVA